MACLLLMEMGDPDAIDGLRELEAARLQPATQDAVRAQLLELAMRRGLASVRPWAYAVATEPDLNPGLQLLAMRTAMRFGEPRALDLWRAAFTRQDDLAEQTRYALVALQLAPWLPPGGFDPLIASEDPFIRQCGRTGAAVAGADADLEAQVIALLQTGHPMAGNWALSYAQGQAEPEDAHQILLGLILICEEDGPQRTRTARLHHAIEAARMLFEMSPTIATGLLRPLVANPKTDPTLVRGVLLGLVQTPDPAAVAVIDGLPPFADPTTGQLALLLRARAGQTLGPTALRDLSVVVRGGGRLDDSLRVQAAWLYLQQTGQTGRALTQLLGTPTDRPS